MKKIMCQGSEGCLNEATHNFHGTFTCYDCLHEHIHDYLLSEAIDEYIDTNTNTLTPKNEKEAGK